MTRNEVENGEVLRKLGFGRVGVRILVKKRRQAMNIELGIDQLKLITSSHCAMQIHHFPLLFQCWGIFIVYMVNYQR